MPDTLCELVGRAFWLGADGEAVASDAAAQVREHLNDCPSCRQRVRSYSELHRRLLEESVKRRIAARPQFRQAGPASALRRWRSWISVAACFAIVAGSLVYNRWRAGQFHDVVVAHVKATAPDVRIERDGVFILTGPDINVRAGDRFVTKEGRGAAFVYQGELTEIVIHKNTTLDIGSVKKGKLIDLRFGAIDATVAPQPVDAPMVVTTPHARAEVKGTRFRLDVDPGTDKKGTGSPARTRLEVYEGIVGLTDTLRHDSVNVLAGHWAEVSNDTALLVDSIDDVPGSSGTGNRLTRARKWTPVYGKVLFEDDFSGDSFDQNWEVVYYVPNSGFETVAGDPERYLEFGEKTLADGTEHSYLRFKIPAEDTDVSGTWFGIRSKHLIKADRFTLEVYMHFIGNGSVMYDWGLAKEADIVPVYNSPVIIPPKPLPYRWEFIPAKDAPLEEMVPWKFDPPKNALRDGMLLGRRSVWHMKRDCMLKVFYIYSRDRKLLIANSGVPGKHGKRVARFEIYRVTVRELLEDADSRDSTERN